MQCWFVCADPLPAPPSLRPGLLPPIHAYKITHGAIARGTGDGRTVFAVSGNGQLKMPRIGNYCLTLVGDSDADVAQGLHARSVHALLASSFTFVWICLSGQAEFLKSFNTIMGRVLCLAPLPSTQSDFMRARLQSYMGVKYYTPLSRRRSPNP